MSTQTLAWILVAIGVLAAFVSLVWTYLGYLADKLEGFSNEEYDD